MATMVVGILGLLINIFVAAVFYRHKETAIVKASGKVKFGLFLDIKNKDIFVFFMLVV